MYDEVKSKNLQVDVLVNDAGQGQYGLFAEADIKLSDPVKVAKDGYEALMKGDDKIISGFKNKAMVASSHIMPDTAVAAQMDKMQQPRDEDKKK